MRSVKRIMAEAIEPTLAQLMGDMPRVALSSMTDINTALIPVPKLEMDSYDRYAYSAWEAQASRDKYADLKSNEQIALQTFLNSLILFPPDDTASSLDPGDPTKAGFPQFGHGSIKLTVLFNDPTDPE